MLTMLSGSNTNERAFMQHSGSNQAIFMRVVNAPDRKTTDLTILVCPIRALSS